MLERLAQVLSDSVEAGPNIFVRFDPEVLDFTDPEAKSSMSVMGMGGNVATVTLTKDNVRQVVGVLLVSVFAKGMKIIAWNWKNFLSYHLGVTGKPLTVEGSLIDLKVAELFAGIKDKAPDTLAAALNRLKTLVAKGIWKEMALVYQKVYLPLITEIIPAMETAGILDVDNRKRVYAYYEICGQDNGRLNCSGAYRDSYVPQTLSEVEKKRLKPKALDEMFMYFDFKNMEVTMLQYLSKDEKLGEVLKNDDAYTTIFQMVTGIDNDPESREKGKIIFLPVVYGQSPPMLAKRLKVAEATAEKIITRIYDLFPAALRWVESHQEQAKSSGFAKDGFGKRRHFSPGEAYLARNFSVQAPSSTVNLEKLVKLHRALKGVSEIAYNVHDGYCVFAGKANWKTIFGKVYELLTSESELCPGLRFRVACHAGRNLDGLKPLQKAKGV